MDKMRMESLDMTAQNIEKIGALFPNCITETVDENGKPKKAINFDLLKQMLSGSIEFPAGSRENLAADINGDGEISAKDSNLIKQIISGL